MNYKQTTPLTFQQIYPHIRDMMGVGRNIYKLGSYEIHPKEHLVITSRASQQQRTIHATLDLLATVSINN